MKKVLLTSFLAGSVLLTGCTTMDPYTSEQQTSKATSGAVIGALAGAAIGAATSSSSDRDKGALIGLASGALVGGGIGAIVDQQEMMLRQELKGSGVRVIRDGEKIHLIMPGDITFDTARYNIRPQFVPTLESIALVLRKYQDFSVQVGGHADSTGSHDPAMNMKLSELRAQSVKDVLVHYGIPSRRIGATGYGYHKPVASNQTAQGRAQNRRVEISIIN